MESLTLSIDVLHQHIHLGMEIAFPLVVGNDGLFRSVECQAFALGSRTDLGNVVKAKYHVLRRHGDRCAIGWVQDVVTLQHQDLCLEDGLIAQWEVYCHLVAVEVGIERRTG